jgi:hypothetical protein
MLRAVALLRPPVLLHSGLCVGAAARRALASDAAAPAAGAVAVPGGKEAAVTAPAAGAPAPAAPKKGGLRQSAAWFLAGCGLSLGLGYLQLSRDIELHTRGVEASLAELRRDTLDSQKVLRKRVAELEAKR